MSQRHLPCFHLKGIVYLNVYAKYDVSVLYTKVATNVKIDNRNNDIRQTQMPPIFRLDIENCSQILGRLRSMCTGLQHQDLSHFNCSYGNVWRPKGRIWVQYHMLHWKSSYENGFLQETMLRLGFVRHVHRTSRILAVNRYTVSTTLCDRMLSPAWPSS